MTANGLMIQPEAFALVPFRVLWERDKSKDKIVAIGELSYMYFMADYTSDYADIIDEEIRDAEVRKESILKKGWQPDEAVKEAINFYRGRQGTVALQLLEDSRSGINKLSTYLRNINFDETTTNKAGEVLPKHDIKKFADTIRQVPAILSALKELEEAVKKEKEAERGLRGGRAKGMYAD